MIHLYLMAYIHFAVNINIIIIKTSYT